MITSAADLKGAYNLLDANSTYYEGFFDNFYVKRQLSPINEIKSIIQLQTRPSKLLFCGHIGCGKTTELRHLQILLENSGFIVIFVGAESVDMLRMDLHHTDVILAIVKKTIDRIFKESDNIDDKLIEELEKLLQKLVGEIKSTTTTKTNHGWKLSAFFAVMGHT